MTKTEKARGLRILMYLSTLVALVFVKDGKLSHLIGGVVTLAALAMYWFERPRFLRLAMMWCGGFLLIVTGEGLLDLDPIVRSVGRSAYDEASRYIVTAHIAMLLGHDLVFSEAAVRPPGAARLALDVRKALPLLLILTIIVLVYFIPFALSTYASGRAAGEVQVASVGGAFLQGFATSASVAVPIVAVWCARNVRGMSRTILFGIALIMMGMQFMAAIRFLLLFSVVGAAIVWIVPRAPRGKVLVAFVGFALALSLVSTVLTRTRTFGLGGADVGGVIRDVDAGDFVLKEGVVKVMSMAVLYTRMRGHTDGSTASAVLVFWVPRALWQDKPTLMGYWLPRFFSTRGFSEGFSASQGFAGNAYVDFGHTGGVVFWFFCGLLLGLFERATARVCAVGDARVILVAPLFGGAFFAVRSFDTTFLLLVGIFVCMFGFIALAGRRERVST